MLENKNHKKISLSGKSLLMGTLSTAAIVLSASTANAATNESNTTASQNQTTSLTNVETKIQIIVKVFKEMKKLLIKQQISTKHQ